MFSRTRGIVACVTLFLFATLISLQAQKVTSTIRGTVTDPTGAAISGADVSVRNGATNATRTAKTSETGEFVIPELDAGTYEVRIKLTNFKEFVTKDVQLNVSSTQVVNATLQVGSTSEQVTVEANPVQVETSTGAVGNVVEGKEVRELPLNGRSFVQLTQLMPGVSPQANFDSKNKGLLAGVDFSVNGNNTTGNIFMVDGVNNNDVGSNRTILVYPSIDAIQEFKILRNSYGPEYGQAMGAIVNIVTRGGTNQFHGTAFYSGRNDVLNATDYFNTLTGAPKDVLRRNDWGYSIGGPIKKDKLFFFWSQEWNHELRGAERDANVPTAAEKGVFDRSTMTFTTAPDFSQLRPANCESQPVVSGNPATAIPAGQFSTAGALLLQLFPDPTIANEDPNLCTNWSVSLTAPIYWREENIRVDYNVANTWHIFARYTHDAWSQPFPSTLGFWGDDAYPSVESDWIQPGVQGTVRITKDFGTAVNDFQVSYAGNRITANRSGLDPALNNLITAALPPDYPLADKQSGADMGYPIFWGGLGNGADSSDLWTQAPWHNNEQLIIFKDDFTKIMGAHSFKLGFLASNNQKNELVNGSSGEAPNFGGLSTGSVDSTNGAFNALWNQVVWNASELQTNPFGQQRWHDYEFYFGDTWKVRRNLTLEYGFRWSFLRQPYVSDNRIASFQPFAYDPALGSDPCNGLILVPGTNFCQAAGFLGGIPGPDRALKENANHAIAPRIGVAWDPKGDGKMAVRLGVGQFFQRERLSNGLSMANNSPFSLSAPSIDRALDIPEPPGAGSGAPNFGVDPGSSLPNTWQWNLTFEREIFRDSKMEIAYVGNRGIHLLRYNDANHVPQSLWQEYSTNQTLASNVSDIDTISSANNGLRPFGRTPGCDPLAEGDCGSFGQLAYAEWKGNSNYHALQALFRTRVKSLDAQFAYTFSKSLSDTSLTSSGTTSSTTVLLNPLNPRLNYGPSYINRPHTLVGEIVYTLPELTGHSTLVRHAAGGWELAGIIDYASGTNLTIFSNGDISGAPGGLTGTGALADATRPNRVAGQPCHAPGSPKFQWLNPAAWTINNYQLGTFGNAGVGECFGPGLANTDFSVHKNFKVGERVNLQFRMDFFNVFNKVQFRGNSEDITGIDTNLINNAFACTAVSQAVFNDDPMGHPEFGTLCGGQVTNRAVFSFAGNGNQQFGQVQHDKGPREIQYSLNFSF